MTGEVLNIYSPLRFCHASRSRGFVLHSGAVRMYHNTRGVYGSWEGGVGLDSLMPLQKPREM